MTDGGRGGGNDDGDGDGDVADIEMSQQHPLYGRE